MDLSKRSSMSEDDELQEVEKDPTGRYVRYSKVLGVGAFKTVYKAFDEDEGIEVAWNKVRLSDDIFNSKDMLRRLCSEADLLKSLKHENIIRCYHSWVDYQHRTINMITELFTSGDLRQYRKKHCHLGVDNKAIKNWARQILKGLDYLHSHNPPIIHRDMKCENIFVNGNSGKVKIGDLGLATVLEHASAHTMIGTPEFMAPEMYDEDYNQLVDVYAFGMCMLQMLTCEIPYSECQNPAQIYKKVTSGKKPAVLSKVTDPQVRQFIEKCLCPVSERLSVIELLKDPFLLTSESSTPRCIPSLTEPITPKSAIKIPKAIISEHKTLKLEGKRKENDSISMTLWISKLGVCAEKVEFLFSLQTDTSMAIATEMERDLGLLSKDAFLVAELIEEFIAELVPGYCKCNLAEAKSSTSETISSRDQDDQSQINVPVIGGKEAPKVVDHSETKIETSGEFHPAASLVEHFVLSTEEVPNSSDHKSLFTSTSASASDCCKRSENTKQEQDANLDKLSRGNKNSRKKVGLSSFLKSLLFHCRKPRTNSSCDLDMNMCT